MQQRRVRIALALGTSLVGAVVSWIVYEQRTKPDVVGFTRPEDFGAEPVDDAAFAALDPDLRVAHPELPSVLDVERPRWPASTFQRVPLMRNDVARLYDLTSPTVRYDPQAYFTHCAGLNLRRDFAEHPDGYFRLRTNELGLREDGPVRSAAPDLRIVVVGDSHVDGVCNNSESFVSLLEAGLGGRHPERTFEALNAGKGGYTFYHYLGTLERLLPLRPEVLIVTVYGGNDFLEGLFLHHHFAGTRASPGAFAYEAEMAASQAVHPASVAQAFQSLKYFDHNPHEVEFALQMARDVSTEIQVTCLRNGIEPIFVYLPPYTDVEWEAQAEVAESMAAALALSPTGLASTERMADSLLAFLADRGVAAIDLRGALRDAGPGHYWRTDEHINLRGMRLVADELLRAFERLGIVERAATRSASRATDEALVEASRRLRSPGAHDGWTETTAAPEIVPLLSEADVAAFVALDDERVYDAAALFRYAPDLDVRHGEGASAWTLVTNGDGLRDDEPVRATAPALRVLIAGDENVAGAWANRESYGNRIESVLRAERPELQVEFLHAAVEGHSFPSYLGVLRSRLDLRPDVFVMTVSGGTDFEELRALIAFARKGAGDEKQEDLAARIAAAREVAAGPVEQGLAAAARFVKRPSLRATVRSGAAETVFEARRLCVDSGIRMIVVYVPSADAAEPQRHVAATREVMALLDVPKDARRALQDLAGETLQRLREAGVDVIDVTRSFQSSPVALYGDDWRLNRAGQERLAEILLPILRRELPEPRQR